MYSHRRKYVLGFAAQMKHYEKNLLSRTHQFSAAVPWEQRNASLFGRFSPYQRLSHREVPETLRIGHR